MTETFFLAVLSSLVLKKCFKNAKKILIGVFIFSLIYPISTKAQVNKNKKDHNSRSEKTSDIPFPNGPHGIFLHAPNLPVNDSISNNIKTYILHNKTVTGANIVIPWSSVDNGPLASPQYDWTFVDSSVKPWVDAGKAIGFLVWGVAEGQQQQFNGKSMTPQYVLDSAHSVYFDNFPQNPRTPVYWEPAYINNYMKFIHAFIERYAKQNWVSYIRFGIGYGAEDFVQNDYNVSPFYEAWSSDGLSKQQWLKYSLAFVDSLGSMNCPKQLMITINNFIFDNTTGVNDLAIEMAAKAVQYNIGIGTQGLSKYDTSQEAEMLNGVPGPKGTADWLRLFAQYVHQVPLEVQTRSWSQPNDGGSVGCLSEMIALALRNNAQILELYPAEWLVAYDSTNNNYSKYHSVYSTLLEQTAQQLSGVNAVDGSLKEHQTNYSLYQNYPNPFNPSTIINYSVPKSSMVSIKVYDVLGREVSTLVNGQKNPGNYNITFNGGKLASGVYFYQLRASDYISIKKMLLLK